MKKCPFCAEDIQDAAVVCRYCNRDLPAPAPAPQPAPVQDSTARPSNKIALIGLAVIIGLAFLGWLAHGGEDDATKAHPTTQAELAQQRANSAAVQQRASLVQQLLDTGFLKSVDCANGVAEVTPAGWLTADADQKQKVTELIANHCDDTAHRVSISMVDSQSGREVASFGAFGYSVK